MVEALKFGSTVRSMKVSGVTIELTDKGVSSMPMVMCMKAVGRMIKRMAMESTTTLTVQNTLATGKTTSSTVKERKCGPMALAMKATTLRDASTAKESSSGLTARSTVAASSTTTSRGPVSTLGATVDDLSASG